VFFLYLIGLMTLESIFCKYELAIAQILLFLVLIREKFVGAPFIFEQKTNNSLI